MVQIAKIQFNPFGENTYILFNSDKECIIVDPGCSNVRECDVLRSYISSNGFKPILVLATHGHIDHVSGAFFAVNEYGVDFAMHGADIDVLRSNLDFCSSMGFEMESVPEIDLDLAGVSEIELGDEIIKILPTPGHTQGGVCLLFNGDKVVLSGDTLFNGSIGRTDLPGGDYDMLIESIINVLLPLGGDVKFFPGHGSESTFAQEVQYNPFISEVLENKVNPAYED